MASLSTLVVMMALSGYAAAQTCGTSGRSCIDRSTCDAATSTCPCNNPPYAWGDGFFQCYRQNQVAAEAKNDVALTTFNNQTVKFPSPCRYLVTHVRQELKGRGREVIGNCEFMVHAYNKRFRGKIVTHGFDVAVSINYNNGTKVKRSVRKYGTAQGGVNSLTTLAAHLYSPNGPWFPGYAPEYADHENKVFIKCEENPANSQIGFELAACGLDVTFVPYDTELRRDQEHIPGLSVGVNCANHPEWLSTDKVIALAPVLEGGSNLDDVVTGTMTAGQSLVHRAFENEDVEQNQPDAHPMCDKTVEMANICFRSQIWKQEGYASCYWMLEEARFIRCVSNNGLNHLELFIRCMESHCFPMYAEECEGVKDEIKGVCGDLTGSAKLTQFLAGDLCPYVDPYEP